MYEGDQARCKVVEGYHARRTTRHLVKEYYTAAPQHETLRSRTLCWSAYFAASCVCRRLVFLHSIEYRINIEVECYHCYKCYLLITRPVSLLSPYRTIVVSQITSSSQSRHCKDLVINYSSTATTVRLIRLIMLPHYLFQCLFFFSGRASQWDFLL